MHLQLCTHKTRMVPRFFALYRETKFFLTSVSRPFFPPLVLPWHLEFGYLIISPQC